MAYVKNINNLINLINYIYGKKMHKNISVSLLQDLLYVSQGICLAVYNEPLFDNDIVAQTHGPHVASVDWKFRGIAHLKSIKHPSNYIKSVLNTFLKGNSTSNEYKIGRIIHCVFSNKEFYMSNGNVLGVSLSEKGTPYDTVMEHLNKTRRNNPFKDDYPDLYTGIPKDLIRNFFSKNVVLAK